MRGAGDTPGATLAGVGAAAAGGIREMMTRIATLSDDELFARRDQIVELLRGRDMSLADLRNREVHYFLIGDEHDLWEPLSSIAFLNRRDERMDARVPQCRCPTSN